MTLIKFIKRSDKTENCIKEKLVSFGVLAASGVMLFEPKNTISQLIADKINFITTEKKKA